MSGIELNTMTDLIALYQQCRSLLPAGVDLFASQEGEDILIKRLLKGLYAEPGYYIDVGAHDPIRFSTTLHYYMRGWRGINIEPNPDVIEKFGKLRPHDVNLNVGVAQQAGQMRYYRFIEPAFNTVCSEQADYAKTKTKLLDIVEIPVEPLETLLNRYLPREQEERLQFINIDVEGFEMAVLKSNDWSRYRPKLILVEALNEKILFEINDFLKLYDYHSVAQTKNTYFFAEYSFKSEYVD